ncbi:MAG: type II secretion system protein GspM [Pseudomonadota bacterium]
MSEFWRNLSERERILVKVAAALGALLAVSQLILAPLSAWRADQKRDLAQAESLYTLVTQAAAASPAGAFAQSDASSLRAAVLQTAAEAGVQLNYVNVRADGAVETSAVLADPDTLFSWLDALRRDHGARVINADIAREPAQPSRVRAQLTLSGGGAG